jgi:hypothetical protein
VFACAACCLLDLCQCAAALLLLVLFCPPGSSAVSCWACFLLVFTVLVRGCSCVCPGWSPPSLTNSATKKPSVPSRSGSTRARCSAPSTSPATPRRGQPGRAGAKRKPHAMASGSTAATTASFSAACTLWAAEVRAVNCYTSSSGRPGQVRQQSNQSMSHIGLPACLTCTWSRRGGAAPGSAAHGARRPAGTEPGPPRARHCTPRPLALQAGDAHMHRVLLSHNDGWAAPHQHKEGLYIPMLPNIGGGTCHRQPTFEDVGS